MKITTHLEPFHYICVEDLYSEEELDLIWEEFNFINKPGKLLSPENTGAATNPDGSVMKRNEAIFLDLFYKEYRQMSNILKVNRKLFSSGILDRRESWFFNKKTIQRDFTLVSYYEDGGNYRSHSDDANLTALSWFFKEPKKFKGGDLSFSDFSLTIPLKNNFMVVFPSQVFHEVSEIQAENLVRGEGRYCIAQFGHYY